MPISLKKPEPVTHEPEVGAQRLYNAGFDPRFSGENAAYIDGNKVVAIKHRLTAQDKQALLAGIHSLRG